MKELFKKYLFEKHMIVNDYAKKQANGEADNFQVLFSLAHFFNIKIISGEKHAHRDMIRFVSAELGIDVPKPFYVGFPDSVRKLSEDELIFDQLLHYAVTYGMGDFSETGHSVFERDFERTAFKENVPVREFSIVGEDAAIEKLAEYVGNLLGSTRPLSTEQYCVVRAFIEEYHCEVSEIASKNTAIRLLIDTRDVRYARFLAMSDVIKVVDEINYAQYGSENLKKLNLKNQDRKFISSIMDELFAIGRCDIRTCFEKKKLWNGLLHHIHYKADTDIAREFTEAMRGKGNQSVFADFEKRMAENNIAEAVRCLEAGKGSGAVLRNLNYLVSRCRTAEDIEAVTGNLDSSNTIVLLQMILQYANYESGREARTFRFTKHNKMKVHQETETERSRRRSDISEESARLLKDRLMDVLKKHLEGRLGKVYIDEEMKNYALPLQETTAQGGYGVLTRGTRLHVPACKKLRTFTYWERVNDIDLSVIGIDSEGRQQEFSWRTMAGRQSAAITYSGDETSGFHGGSEYFDIDIEKFKREYPNIRYLIFCDNVFSGCRFTDCYCKAGYMLRDIEDSGEVYEPKTVESSFLVNAESRFAYLFGFDVETNDFLWLNVARDSSLNIAGKSSMAYLIDYFHITEVINVYSFFEMMAAEVVDSMEEAEVIVTNKTVECGADTEVIREYDFEKMIKYMNDR